MQGELSQIVDEGRKSKADQVVTFNGTSDDQSLDTEDDGLVPESGKEAFCKRGTVKKSDGSYGKSNNQYEEDKPFAAKEVNSSHIANMSQSELSIDISRNDVNLALLFEKSNCADASDIKQGYVFDNTFTIVPHTIKAFKKLKVLKIFSNNVKYLPKEVEELQELEHLQVKMHPSGLDSIFPLEKLADLKSLELHQILPKPSASIIPTNISQMQSLTRLAICHFSISCLPPEIGSLRCLKELDLSFNKLKLLPSEIGLLKALTVLKVASNKLVRLPSELTDLPIIRSIDISYNKLTSLQSLGMHSMKTLLELDARCNKLQRIGEVPFWIKCNFEGNESLLHNFMVHSDARLSNSNATIVSRKIYSSSISSKGAKFTDSQYRTRQDRLIRSRYYKVVTGPKLGVISSNEQDLESCAEDLEECRSKKVDEPIGDEEDQDTKLDSDDNNNTTNLDLPALEQKSADSPSTSNFEEHRDSTISVAEGFPFSEDAGPCLLQVKRSRECSENGESDSSYKKRRLVSVSSKLSYKYFEKSFCGFDEYMHDGFYDAGRGHPFLPLDELEEEGLRLGTREVILVDRSKDDNLDVTVSLAKQFLASLGTHMDDCHRASVLALFVSNHFGGSDSLWNMKQVRRTAHGGSSIALQTCSCLDRTWNMANGAYNVTSNSLETSSHTLVSLSNMDICNAKQRQRSNIVPLGALQFGVCRHRALLFKYLCDRINPPVRCAVVRGYLDYTSHAWNIIIVKKNNLDVCMLVDACHPFDIRPEDDPEYFCRYLPLKRVTLPGYLGNVSDGRGEAPMLLEEIGCGASGAVVYRCLLEGHTLATKVRQLSTSDAFLLKQSGYRWLSELHILYSIGEHPCIVSFYGHELQLVPETATGKDRIASQLMLFLEYMKTGTLQDLKEKLMLEGNSHMPAAILLHIAKSVVSGLAWLHSKNIIHRDIKATNILLDMESAGMPIVKICDFDSAVSLNSSAWHGCYLAHLGVPSMNSCIGTLRWMAPEVLNSNCTKQSYGLETDIWSFGCLLGEMLTLDVPYAGLDEAEVCSYLQRGERPVLHNSKTGELLLSIKDDVVCMATSLAGIEGSKVLKELIHIFISCTQKEPSARPSAKAVLEQLMCLSMRTVEEKKQLQENAAASVAMMDPRQ